MLSGVESSGVAEHCIITFIWTWNKNAHSDSILRFSKVNCSVAESSSSNLLLFVTIYIFFQAVLRGRIADITFATNSGLAFVDWNEEKPSVKSRLKILCLRVHPPSWKLKYPREHRSHLGPVTPGWHRHWPFSSQSNDLEPYELQWHGMQVPPVVRPWVPAWRNTQTIGIELVSWNDKV